MGLSPSFSKQQMLHAAALHRHCQVLRTMPITSHVHFFIENMIIQGNVPIFSTSNDLSKIFPGLGQTKSTNQDAQAGFITVAVSRQESLRTVSIPFAS
jgi:hypothetical protein